jgi:hypothetical protein
MIQHALSKEEESVARKSSFHFLSLFFLLCVVLGVGPRALHMLGRYGLLTQIPALEIITAWEQKMKKMRTEELKTRRREKQQVFFYQRGNPKGYTHEIQ